jgi:uncharacterized protein (DUF1697 family)
MSRVYVAFLRGINLSGHNRVSMKDLALMFGDAGCDKVQTYIQSGNVIFRDSAGAHAKVPKVVSGLIKDRLGLQIPIVIRTLEQMTAVAAGNPFLLGGAPETELYVMFLADTPPKTRVALLDPDRSPPHEFRVLGQEIYLRLPKGFAQTKLTNAYFDSKLATVSTFRNWRTVMKVLALMRLAAAC